jgi:hypothetical protein
VQLVVGLRRGGARGKWAPHPPAHGHWWWTRRLPGDRAARQRRQRRGQTPAWRPGGPKQAPREALQRRGSYHAKALEVQLAPLLTAPLLTAPLLTAPLLTAPLLTAPWLVVRMLLAAQLMALSSILMMTLASALSSILMMTLASALWMTNSTAPLEAPWLALLAALLEPRLRGVVGVKGWAWMLHSTPPKKLR